MGQNEIFKLLLIILLLINSDGECDGNRTLTGNINSIIIIMLLLGFNCPDNPNNTTTTTTF